MSVMAWGMLWYDGDPKRSMEEKVELAAARYQEKYGEWPNTCFVKDDLGELMVKGCKVIGNSSVLRNHLWLGVS